MTDSINKKHYHILIDVDYEEHYYNKFNNKQEMLDVYSEYFIDTEYALEEDEIAHVLEFFDGSGVYYVEDYTGDKTTTAIIIDTKLHNCEDVEFNIEMENNLRDNNIHYKLYKKINRENSLNILLDCEI